MPLQDQLILGTGEAIAGIDAMLKAVYAADGRLNIDSSEHPKLRPPLIQKLGLRFPQYLREDTPVLTTNSARVKAVLEQTQPDRAGYFDEMPSVAHVTYDEFWQWYRQVPTPFLEVISTAKDGQVEANADNTEKMQEILLGFQAYTIIFTANQGDLTEIRTMYGPYESSVLQVLGAAHDISSTALLRGAQEQHLEQVLAEVLRINAQTPNPPQFTHRDFVETAAYLMAEPRGYLQIVSGTIRAIAKARQPSD